jgi:hypothetical protein
MNKLLLAICLIPIIPGLASAAAVVGGGAAAGVMIAGSAAHSNTVRVRNQSEAAKRPSDCAACHIEIFPFNLPDTCIRSNSFECWRERYVGGSTRIMTRDEGKVRKVYRLRVNYGRDRIFLPAEDETLNPHYVLEVR